MCLRYYKRSNSMGKLYILWICTFSYVLAQDPVANLQQGRVVGIKVFTKNSLTPVEIFFGIPYATPPTGRYRFSAPERHPGWRRTFFAHRMPPRCPQLGDVENDYFSEDCLYLNIWTPRRADGNSLPVLVILHSESWLQGGASLLCQELAAEGVVVVTVMYRFHLLAFFTLKSLASRGNLALLDQYMALIWIRENISGFGGDPTAITLLGHSTGADSVLYHIASPRSVGLFRRAIVMSPRDIWKAIEEQKGLNANEVERISHEVAHVLGCTSKVDQEILNCMRARPIKDILSLYSNTNWSVAMQPIPDDFLPVSEQYLPTSLSVALSAVKQPVMQLDLLLGTVDLEVINYNDDEHYNQLIKESPSYVSEYTNTKAIPEILRMLSLDQSEALPVLVQAVRWEYWGEKTGEGTEKEVVETIEALARAQTSAKWGTGIALTAARLARRVTRLYVYRYSQPGVDLYGRQFNFTGAVHGADLVALLGDALMLQVARRPANPDEQRTSSRFRQYITNFVKFGSPGRDNEWQRYKVGDAHVHEICDKDIPNTNTRSVRREIAFWLQYLQQLTNVLTSSEHTEHFTSEKGESRLRGGVFALCGVSVVLLLLLCACAILLRRERSRRSSITDDDINR